MNANYTFEVDPSRDFVRLQMRGFFSPADLPAFMAARQASHARLTCAANAHVTLIDARELKIQSQEMIDAFGRMLSVSGYHARRLAFVIPRGLLRTQLCRAIGDREDVSHFESVRMAEAWLFASVAGARIQNLVGQQALRTSA